MKDNVMTIARKAVEDALEGIGSPMEKRLILRRIIHFANGELDLLALEEEERKEDSHERA